MKTTLQSDSLALIQTWVNERARSPHTQRSYECELERFRQSLPKGVTLQSCRDTHVAGYLADLARPAAERVSPIPHTGAEPLSHSSLQQARRVLNAFFEWMVRSSRRTTNPLWATPTALQVYEQVTGKVAPGPKATTLTSAVTNLLTPDTKHLSVPDHAKLWFAVVANLSFWAGATTSEIHRLTIRDLHLSNDPPTILMSKRGSKVHVVIPPHVAMLLETYLTARLGRNLKATGASTAKSTVGWLNGRRIAGVRSSILQTSEGSDVIGDSPAGAGSPQSCSFRLIRRAFADIAIREGCQEFVLAHHRRRGSAVFTPPPDVPQASIGNMLSLVMRNLLDIKHSLVADTT